MNLLKQKIPFSYHDKIEEILDKIYARGSLTDLDKFNKVFMMIRSKFLTSLELEKEYPNNRILRHNREVLCLCSMSVVLARGCYKQKLTEMLKK